MSSFTSATSNASTDSSSDVNFAKEGSSNSPNSSEPLAGIFSGASLISIVSSGMSSGMPLYAKLIYNTSLSG